MRIRAILVLIFVLLLSSCIVKKKTTYSKNKTVTVTAKKRTSPPPVARKRKINNPKVNKIVSKAMSFAGTRYKFGGNTKKGIDCSGLIHVALKDNDIPFPRVSYQMANEGKRINLKDVAKGDLLFFKTSKSGKRINHVGLVVEVNGGEIRFIHATSSRGVIVSSLREGYWNHAFIKATRIL